MNIRRRRCNNIRVDARLEVLLRLGCIVVDGVVVALRIRVTCMHVSVWVVHVI